MSRLIDADALKFTEYLGMDEPVISKSEIDAAPTVEPKRGEWKDCQWFDEHYGRCYECNVCEGTVIGKQNFCPNCGADMREVKK